MTKLSDEARGDRLLAAWGRVRQAANRMDFDQHSTWASLDAVPLAVIMIRSGLSKDTNGYSATCNQAAYELMGLAPTYKPLEDWIEHYQVQHPEDGRPYEFEELPAALALQGKRVDRALMSVLGQRGDRKTLVVSATPIYCDEEVTGCVLVCREAVVEQVLCALPKVCPSLISIADAD